MKPKEAIQFVADHGDEYAQAYAKAMLKLWGTVDASWCETQLLYILSNFGGCRCPGAKEARDTLKYMLAMAEQDTMTM